MSQSQNTSNQVNQEIALPENNEELIRMLGLDEYADSDSGKLVDNMIIGNLDIDSTLTSNGIPMELMQFENMQGYQLVGNSLGYQQTEIISYVDMAPF